MRIFAIICHYLFILNVVLYYYDCVTIIIILYIFNSKYFDVICAYMFYVYSVCVIIYANKDDDDYYCSFIYLVKFHIPDIPKMYLTDVDAHEGECYLQRYNFLAEVDYEYIFYYYV